MEVKKNVEKLLCYCRGKLCSLRESCRRHRELNYMDKPVNSFTIDACDSENREMYVNENKKDESFN